MLLLNIRKCEIELQNATNAFKEDVQNIFVFAFGTAINRVSKYSCRMSCLKTDNRKIPIIFFKYVKNFPF